MGRFATYFEANSAAAATFLNVASWERSVRNPPMTEQVLHLSHFEAAKGKDDHPSKNTSFLNKCNFERYYAMCYL